MEKCGDWDMPLSDNLGIPGCFPLHPDCPEEQLDSQTIVHGYRDSADAFGITEANETSLSLFYPPSLGTTQLPQPLHVLQAIKAEISTRTATAAPQQTTSRHSREPAPANTQLRLPPLRVATAEELAAWLHELAGSHDLSFMALSVPDAANKQLLLKALWQARVPAIRAAWYIRILHLHWYTEPTTIDRQASGLVTITPSETEDGRLARAGSINAVQGTGTKGITRKFSTGSPNTVLEPEHLLSITPDVISKCSSAWSALVLEHIDSCLSAATAFLLGQPVPVGNSASTPLLPHTPMTPYPDIPASPLPGFDMLPDSTLGLNPNPAGQSAGASVTDLAMRSQTPLPGAGQPNATTYPSAIAVANEVLAANAAEILDPGPFARLWYFINLASHTFNEGLSHPNVVLEWAEKLLVGSAGPNRWSGNQAAIDADLVKAWSGITLLQACGKDLAVTPGASKKLATMLVQLTTDWQQLQLQNASDANQSSSMYPTLLDSKRTSSIPVWCGITIDSVRMQAADILKILLNSCPSVLITLDCLPQLMAELAWAQQQRLTNTSYSSSAAATHLSVNLDELPSVPDDFASVLKVMLGNAEVQPGPRNGNNSSQVAVPVHPGPSASAAAYLSYIEDVAACEASCMQQGSASSNGLRPTLNAQISLTHLKAAHNNNSNNNSMLAAASGKLSDTCKEEDSSKILSCVAAKARSMESAVHPKILVFNQAAAMQRLESAFWKGDINLAYEQLEACMGKEGLRDAESAVALACNFALANPYYLPEALTSHILDPTSQEQLQPEHHTTNNHSNINSSQSSTLQPELGPRALFCARLLSRLHTNIAKWITNHANALSTPAQGNGFSEDSSKPNQSRPSSLSGAPVPPTGNVSSSGTTAAMSDNTVQGLAPSRASLASAAMGQGLLQQALYNWVDNLNVQLCHNCQKKPQGFKQVHDPQRVVNLLLTLQQTGLWSCKQYASKLVADGVFFSTPASYSIAFDNGKQQHSNIGAETSAKDLKSPLIKQGHSEKIVRAAKHWVLLKLLHPTAVMVCSERLSSDLSVQQTGRTPSSDSYVNLSYKGLRKQLLSAQPQFLSAWKASGPDQVQHPSQSAVGLNTVSAQQQHTGSLQPPVAQANETTKQLKKQDTAQQLLTFSKATESLLDLALADTTASDQSELSSAMPLEHILQWLDQQPPSVSHIYAANVRQTVLQTLNDCCMTDADTAVSIGVVHQMRKHNQENEAACSAAASVVIPQSDQEFGVSTPDLPESRTVKHSNGKQGFSSRAAGLPDTHTPNGGKANQHVTEKWLLQAVTLLDASGAHDTAIDLLLGMLKQLASSLPAAGTQREQHAQPGATVSGSDMSSISHGQVIALLAALKDRLVAAGLNRLLGLTTDVVVSFTKGTSASLSAVQSVTWRAFLSDLLRFSGACASLALHGTSSTALSDMQPRQPGSNPASTNANNSTSTTPGADLVVDHMSFDVHAWLESLGQAVSNLEQPLQQWIIEQLKSCAVAVPNQQQQSVFAADNSDTSTHHHAFPTLPSALLASPNTNASFDQLVKHCQRQLLRHDQSNKAMQQAPQPEASYRFQALPNSEVGSACQMLLSSFQTLSNKQAAGVSEDTPKSSTAGTTQILASATQWIRRLLASKGLQIPLQQTGTSTAPVRSAVASVCTAILMTYINSHLNLESAGAAYLQDRSDSLELILGLEQFLTAAGIPESCSCMRQGLLAAVAALLSVACIEAVPQADKRDVVATIASFTCSAAVIGLVQLPDAVTVVKQQAPGAMSLWLYYIVGPGLLHNQSTADSSQGHTKEHRHTLPAAEAYIVELLQQRLPAELIWQHIQQPLIPEAVTFCNTHGLGQGGGSPNKCDALMRSVIYHKPLRTVLLSDPVWLHSQLRSASCINAVATATAEVSGLQPIQSANRLPLLVAMVLLQGGLPHVGLTSSTGSVRTGPAITVSGTSALDWETQYRRCMHALLASAHTSNRVLVSVMMRLLLDQRAAIEMLQDDSNRQSIKEVLEATQCPFNAEGDANATSGGGVGIQNQKGTARLTAGMPAAPLEATTAEKLLCSCMLSQLLDTPESAALYADMAWQLGVSVGTWLLRTTGWLLEDRQDVQLSGTQSIRQVVARTRTGKTTGAALLNNMPTFLTDSHVTVNRQQQLSHGSNQCYACLQQAVMMDARQGGWSMEKAVLTLALVLLSQARAQLKPFAAELIRQLNRVAEILKRATTAAASYTMSAKDGKQTEKGSDDAMSNTPFKSGGGAGLKRGRSPSMDGTAGDEGAVGLEARPSKQQCLNDGTGGQGMRSVKDEDPTEAVDMDLGSPSGSVGVLKSTGLAADEATNTRDTTMRERAASVGTSPRQSLTGRFERGGGNADVAVVPTANDTRRSSDGGAAGQQAGSKGANEAGANATGNAGDGTGASTAAGGKKRAFGQGRFGRGGTLRLGNNPPQPSAGNLPNPNSTTAEAANLSGKGDSFPPASTGPVPASKPLLATNSFQGSDTNTIATSEPVLSNTNVILGPPEAIQTAVWLRLSLLLPLLPVVYSDKETDARRNLRMQLVSCLNQMLVSPIIQPGLLHSKGRSNNKIEGCPIADHPLLKVLQHQSRQQLPSYSEVEVVSRAAVEAVTAESQEFLWERLFNVLVAMLSGSTPSWPAWLKGSHSKKLKEVAPYAGTDQLLQDMAKAERAIKAGSAVWYSAAHNNSATVDTSQTDGTLSIDGGFEKPLNGPLLPALLGYQPVSDFSSEPLPVTISYEFLHQQKHGIKSGRESDLKGLKEPVSQRQEAIRIPFKLSLQTVLMQAPQPPPQYVNVSYNTIRCAQGPPMGRSGPWAGTSKTAVDAIKDSLKTQQDGMLPQLKQPVALETVESGEVENAEQLVSCWVPTPIETCAPWRHDERGKPSC